MALKMKTRRRNIVELIASLVIVMLCLPAWAQRIRDVARLKNEQSWSIEGMGLVVGLKGTGDGGDDIKAVRLLAELSQQLGDKRTVESEIRNANNIAIVRLSVVIPAEGAHAGEKLDVMVSSIGHAKSLKGGQLFLAPMLLRVRNEKRIIAMATGECMLDDETHPTTARIRGGAVLSEDCLAEEIKDRFTLVLHPNTANSETATVVADQINEDVREQTGGKAIAVAVDSTSVDVTIPPAEQKNVTQFIARVRSLPLPSIPDPAKVVINTKNKTIVFTEEVELAPTTISYGVMTIEISGAPAANGAGVPVAVPAGARNTKLKDLMEAFRLYKVSPDDRIAIVRLLHDSNALKAELEIQ